jgi:lipopolysaccharide export system protein LptC
MPSLKRMTWILPTIGLLLVCIWHWLHSAQRITHLLDHYALEQSPNVTIQDLQYRQYDAQGTLTHCLKAPKMHHIPKNDVHIFTQPHLVVTEANQAPWEIHADYGTAASKGQTITLDQHVQINQHKNNEETELKTEHLTYYPQEKKATSSDEVTVTQGGSHIHSQGMVADLAENHIHLLQARGRHVRNTA